MECTDHIFVLVEIDARFSSNAGIYLCKQCRRKLDEINAAQIRCRRIAGQIPNDTAAVKLLWQAIRNIEDKRARQRAKEAGRPRSEPRKAPGKLVEGSTIQGWKAALGELALIYPDRINRYL